MAAPPTVDILLAAYNGQAYLPELLDSLDAQTCASWRLLIRDDGSTDETEAILDAFADRHAGQVRRLRDGQRGLGPRGNFARLLQAATADYVMFCDQDDVWLPTKIERTLAAMTDAEQRAGARTPLLVHTDLRVVDEKLAAIDESYWNYQKFDPAGAARFSRLAVQNAVTGCTVMINAALRDLAGEIPPDAVMHDWWLALIAAAFGTIVAVDEPTILYRQHGRNDTGAKRWGPGYILQKARSFGAAGGLADRLKRAQRQAEAFCDRYGDRLDARTLAAARAYATIGERGFLRRRLLLLRHGLLMHGRPTMSLVKNIGLMLRI